MRRAAFLYSQALSGYRFSEEHVLRPTRLQYSYELLHAYGAFRDPSSLLIEPEPASEADLLSFHTKDYIEAVKRFSEGDFFTSPETYNFSYDGDNPPFRGMYDVSCLVVGASLKAAALVADGEVQAAFNAAGGLHHAMPGYASGFCIFNDPVIAIISLLKRGMRVAYVDIDAHHGDGVQYAFYGESRVLTISLHETGRYLFPGTGEVAELGSDRGRGYTVNLPLAPYTDDKIYIWTFREVVLPLVQRFQPDVLVTQLGADAHYQDPLAHLCLTTGGYEAVYQEMAGLAPRWLALGGGGYEVSVVPRIWTLAYGALRGISWPDTTPLEYQERYGVKRLRDEVKPELSEAQRQRALEFAQRGVQQIKELIFPLHGL